MREFKGVDLHQLEVLKPCSVRHSTLQNTGVRVNLIFFKGWVRYGSVVEMNGLATLNICPDIHS